MRRKGMGLGVVSVLFSALVVAACSASGNEIGSPGGGGGSAGTDSGAVADSSYGASSDTGVQQVADSGASKKDSGSVTPVVDSGPAPVSADCDLSGSGLISAIPALQSGGDGVCGTADACPTGDCCVNFASLFSGGGLPTAFTAIFSSGSPPTCVAR